MKRFFVIFLVFGIIAIGIAGAYAYFIFIPEKVEQTVVSAINRFGFENPAFGSLKREKNKIILKDVVLDSERFSTIEELSIRYSLFKFLVNKRHAQDITIKGLNLTGELSGDFIPVIAGWDDNARIVKSLQTFPAGKIFIDSTTLNLLSEKFGGIKVTGAGQIIIHGNGQVSVKANTKSTQKKLTFSSKLEASIASDRNTNFKAEFEDLSVELETTEVKRGSGIINGTYIYNNTSPPSLELSGEMQFASLRWYDMPLSAVKVKTDYTDTERHFSLAGSTFGPEEISWNADISHEGELFNSNVQIMPKSLNDVQKFLGRSKKLGVNAYLPKALLDIASPSIQIKNTYSPSAEERISGEVDIKYKNPIIAINTKYQSDLEIEESLNGKVRMEETVFRPTANSSDGTRFNISSFGKFSLKNYKKKPAFLWIARVTVHDSILDFGSVKIPGINGVVLLGGTNKSKQENEYTLDFSFPLKDGISHKGDLLLNADDTAEKSLLECLSLKIYGGEIKTQEPIAKDGQLIRKNTLDVSNIDLESLTSDAQLPGIYVSGKLAGILPFEAKDGGVHVNGGLLQSQDTGIIRLSKTMTEGLFPDNTSENALLRKALENFHYEFFEIRLDGDLSGRVMMTINARGQNPDIKSKKPIDVDVNLQIETQISLLFKALMLDQG